jgi:PPIC-type PPIASE domain
MNVRTFWNGDLRWFAVWAVLAVLAGSGLACGSKKTPPDSPAGSSPVPGKAVLQVGGSTYREADFARYASAAIGRNWQKLGAATLSQFFDKFVDDRLLLQAALDDRISLTPEEKLGWIQKLKDEGWTPEEEDAALTSDSGPLAERLKVEKFTAGLVKDVSVSDDEVRAYYESHKDQFYLPERIKVSQILLPTEAAAVEVWERLRGASEDDFRAVAKAESVGPEASDGGQMGVFQKGQLPPEMEDSILSLQAGEISPIVKSSYGFHIFRLDEKYAAEQTTLENASDSIRINLLDQKVKEVVARRLLDLRESLEWTAYPEGLPFAYQKVER